MVFNPKLRQKKMQTPKKKDQRRRCVLKLSGLNAREEKNGICVYQEL